MGIKIYSDFINKKNENNEYYYYECLASISEYAPYDMVIQKHNKDDWGNYTITYHEIKMRNEDISFNDYETSDIDLNKIKSFQEIAYQTNCRTFINVIYPKDKCICQWEIIPDEKYNVVEKDINWKSASIRENREVKIHKRLVELPISEAKKFRY